MFGKLFESMYDGTLGTKGPWQAIIVLQQLVILSDQHGVIDMTPEVLARRTTIPLEIFLIGIPPLEATDPESRSPAEGGRRIVRLDPNRSWGWRVVNKEQYARIGTQAERRAYMATLMRDRRAREKDNGSPSDPPPLATVSTAGPCSMQDADANTDTPSNPSGSAVASPGVVTLSIDDEWAIVKAHYPQREGAQGWVVARERYGKHRKGGVPFEAILGGVDRYRLLMEHAGKVGTALVAQAETFFGRGKRWTEEYPIPAAGTVNGRPTIARQQFDQLRGLRGD